MSTIAFIPIRSGSKSIPNKNIKKIAGKPLIFWTLLAAENCQKIDEIHVAIDSEEYKTVIQSFKFQKVNIYNRLKENAEDSSSTESVMIEFLNSKPISNDDIFILIQATSPLLEARDLTEALERFSDKKIDSIVSCSRTKRFLWSDNGTALNYDIFNRPRRQDFSGFLIENGAFYISTVDKIFKSNNRISGNILTYEMEEYCLTEIDEEDDLVIIENLIKKYHSYFKAIETIKIVLTDVDGVLTDAGMYYDQTGNELKKFNTRDGMGFQLLKEAGIRTGIITSENTEIVARRAKKVKVDYLYQGIKDKLSVVQEICNIENISLKEVAYIGDDINDFEVLNAVGFSFCPSDAIDENKRIVKHVLNSKGGEGAFREMVIRLLKK